MKIVLLAPANNVHTHKWLDYYQKKGYQVINVSFETHRDEVDRSHWTNVKRHYLPLKFNHKLAYFLTVKQLKKLLNEEKPDFLHSHYVSSYGVIGAMTGFHPYVISVWGSDIYDFPKEGALKRKMVEYALKHGDAICSTSEVMKVETAQYTNKYIYVTPFGVDMERFKPMPGLRDESKVTFGIVKTMKDKYGIRYLVEAYKHFKDAVSKEDYEKTKLVIVGGGPQLEEYRELARELGIGEQVTFTGNIPHDEVPKMINTLDVFFVPSTLDSESFGVAAVEAQACEVPVVVANVGGLPEVTLDGETGYIVPTKNSEALAEKMVQLYHDDALRSQLGKNGRAHVLKHYEWNDNAELMSQLYEKMLKN